MQPRSRWINPENRLEILKVRKISFDLKDVEFIWNSSSPNFSVFANQFSFWIIGLEKYFCKAILESDSLITNQSLRSEAALFVQQEAQHLLAHRAHVDALIKRYPSLQKTLDNAIQHYENLYEKECLDYHLAYVAGEAAFAPFFGMCIDNREAFFRKGDANVSSLFLWHFCEEIEHRSSGLKIYNHVVGGWWWKIRKLPSMIRHIEECFAAISRDFQKHVPASDWGNDINVFSNPLKDVSIKSRLRCVVGVLAAQLPWHNPAHTSVPGWVGKWSDSYEENQDMARFFGSDEP